MRIYRVLLMSIFKSIKFSLYVRAILMQQIWEQFDLRNIF